MQFLRITKMMLFILIAGSAVNNLAAQGVAINSDDLTPNEYAILDISSTEKGILIPRMSTVDRNDYALDLTQDEKGMLVFDIDINHFFYWNGIAFVQMNAGSIIQDKDNDTRIRVEMFPDDDVIRFYSKGEEKWRMTGDALYALNSGGSVLIGEYAGWQDDGTDKGTVAIGRAAAQYSDDRNYLVAIGDSALYSNGSGNITGFDGTYNTGVGSNVMRSNKSGSANTAIGAKAMYKNISGSNNTSGGSLSMYFNTTGDNNTAMGVLSLGANTTGDNNSAIGHLSLSSNTSGTDNVALGGQALGSNSTGNGNVALGKSAMKNNEQGNSNIAIGHKAMYNADGKSNIIAIGDSALYNNGTGTENPGEAVGNVAIGSKAMFQNTTGRINCALGAQALYSNTEGGANVGIGTQAMYNNLTGSSNTSVGTSSLLYNEQGSFNTAMGYNAMRAIIDGSSNVAIGYEAMQDNVHGQKNTAVGGFALQDNYDGDYNTAIGYFARTSYSANATALGYYASANDSNTVRIGNYSVTSIGGVVGWSNLSDSRFKDNVQENVVGLDFIERLRPVTYNLDVHAMNDHLARNYGIEDSPDWEGKYENESITYTGFIAQEVLQAANAAGYDFSGIEVPDDEKGYYALRYAEFVVPLVKAVQEQQEVITDLQARIEALEELVRNGDN